MNSDAASAKPVRPTWRQALVMLGGGTLLASSACYGAVGFPGADLPPLIFTAGFVIGMVLALVGVIMAIVRSARAPLSRDASAPASPRPEWGQTLVMLASGPVLGASSCYGFLEALGGLKRSNLYGAFATGFYVGCLIALGGLVMALIRVVRSLRKSMTKNV